MDVISVNIFDESDNDDEKLDYLPDLHLINEDTSEKFVYKASIQESGINEPSVTIDGIASRLINDRFLLTALEFHMELTESGHELPRLRDFFSNPANFERGRTIDPFKLTRTSSIQTFDSLDFARYSDDGEKHENDRIAVLEFELRKAHEKINSLRTSLTKTAETDLHPINFDSTNIDFSSVDETPMPYERRALNFLINEYLLKHGYKLTSVTFSEENDGQDFDDWDDVGINISKPPNLLKLFRDYGNHTSPLIPKKDFECMVNLPSQEETNNFNINLENKVNTLQKNIDSLEYKLEIKVKENIELKLSFEELKNTVSNNSIIHSPENILPSKVEENFHPNDINSKDNKCIEFEAHKFSPEKISQQLSDLIPDLTSFQKKVLLMISKDREISKLINPESFDSIPKCLGSIVEVLGDTLPKIVPNILLAKRDELISLLIDAAALHPCQKKRDELLSNIFNLIKRPNIEQRHAIMSGCIAFAKHVGPLQTEGELLPQCWEQIFHKYPERRLLVVETCGCLSPYVLDQTRSSLLFSMLDQMSGDKEEDVREAVVKSLAVVASFLENADKYGQIVNLLGKLLGDPSERVVSASKSILLPVIAKWSLDLKCLEKFLNQIVMEPIETSIYQASSHYAVKDQKLFVNNMTNLHNLLPFIVAYVISACHTNKLPSSDRTQESNEVNVDTQSLLSTFDDEESLSNIRTILCEDDIDGIIDHFYQTISQEWFASWSEYDWLINELLHRLIDLSTKLEISQPSLHFIVSFFKDLCVFMGAQFSQNLMKSKFEKLLIIPFDENSLDRALMTGQSILNRSIIPIFIAGVYTSILNEKMCSEQHDENYAALFKFLCDLLRSLAIHQSTLISLQASFTELYSTNAHHLSDMIFKVLWSFGVMHKNQLVRAATSQVIEHLVSTCSLSDTITASKIVPALITLASDTDENVRVSTISPLGTILEYVSTAFDQNSANTKAIIEKVQVQLQAFMEESSIDSKHKSQAGYSTSTCNLYNLEIIKVLGRVGPKVDTRFRDDFVLPRLTALAVRNQLSLNTDLKSKQEVAMRLLDAFINISCCFLSRQISHEVVLPGLKCLHHDIQALAPDRVNIILSLIKEMEDKIEEPCSRISIRSTSKIQNQMATSQGPNFQAFHHMEMTKNNLMSRIKGVKDKATNAHFTKMFQMSKR